MSLADELLADLEEDDEVPGDGHDANYNQNGGEEMDVENETKINSEDSVRNVATLNGSERLNNVLSQMKEFLKNPRTRDSIVGPVELDPEFKLIVDANNLTVEIDNQITIIHKYCRDLYSKRFPELESLVPSALDYINSCHALGNELKASKIEGLDFLQPATKMVVSVSAATTQGEVLEQSETERLNEACQMAADLTEAKINILNYVESRMSFIAPNISIIIGASTAAKILGIAGGLTVLSKMPACNILLLGAQKKTLSGFSSTSILPHTGFIYFSEIVQVSSPSSLFFFELF